LRKKVTGTKKTPRLAKKKEMQTPEAWRQFWGTEAAGDSALEVAKMKKK